MTTTESKISIGKRVYSKYITLFYRDSTPPVSKQPGRVLTGVVRCE
jgi:hypothetical protein